MRTLPDVSAWYRALSLKSRILLLALVSTVVLVTLVVEYVAQMLTGELQASAEQRLALVADNVAREIDAQIRLRVAALDPVAHNMTAAIIAEPQRTLRALAQNPFAALLFSEGMVVANQDLRVVADLPHIESRSGASLRDREYAEALIKGRRYSLGKPRIGTFTRKPTVVLGTPLYRGDSLQGLLLGVIGLNDKRVFGVVDRAELGAKGYVAVISPRHRLVVAANDNGRILQALPAVGIDPLLDQRIGQRYEGAGLSSSWNDIESLTVAKNIASTDWMAVVGLSQAEIMAPAAKLRRNMYLAGCLAAIVFALILYLVMQRATAPLSRAAGAMKRMTDGEEPFAALPADGAGEVGQLIASFNSLVAERRRADEHRQHFNVQLGQRVEQRTQELSQTIQALNKEVAQRWAAETQALQFSDRLQELSRRFVDVEEAEKRRLARELHDRVSSSLMAIGLSIGLVKKDLGRKSDESLRERLSDLAGLVKDTMLSAREISSELHPAALEYDGLSGALDDYAKKFSARTGLAVRVNCHSTKQRLTPERETALFRIVQEALMNSAKHARARRTEVTLDGDEQRLILTAADDGVGFDPIALAADGGRRSGLGLLSMRERAEFAGGALRVESHPGQGTRIIVELPT